MSYGDVPLMSGDRELMRDGRTLYREFTSYRFVLDASLCGRVACFLFETGVERWTPLASDPLHGDSFEAEAP